MRDIHCPKDIGFENTFSGEDCDKEQHYNNCYHCWTTALAKGKAHWVEYKPGRHRCSNCYKDAFVKWSPSQRDNVDVLTNYCSYCGRKMVKMLAEKMIESEEDG